MPQYDFLNLSASEFENLSRDLLQKEFNVHIESFTEGKDGGIDLRFARFRGKNEIVQCKRYKDYASLISVLKKEAKELKGKKIDRYYVTTSVGLTPNNKQTIFKLFSGFIKSEADIFGKNDLNNLLGKYQTVESQYYKLWLSSTNILQKILHSKIYNQSEFEIEEIRELIRVYVQNDSFNESLKILNENRFVIISGIPGIGKTTLARILVYHLLSKGFEEFAFLSDSISEGYDIFKEDKKQVFLFDDFLGRNFLETSKGKNEEQSIIKFIDKIKKSTNKALVFTTREYILKQAQIKFELFNKNLFDDSKCIVDLSKYTKMVKAQILYNHLYFSGLPFKYVEEILKDRFCLRLVNHQNYNPRIIETFTQNRVWENIEISQFQNQLQQYFDYPNDVWRHTYENQITDLSKCVLAVMLTTGTPILYHDLLLAIQSFAKNLSQKYNIKFSEQEFKKSLKELENTFIITKKDNNGIIAIEYQNPSIQDFLVNYLSEQNDLITDLIKNAIFFNQLSGIFTFYEEPQIQGKLVKQANKVLLKNDLSDQYIDKIISDFDYLNSSQLIKYRPNSWTKSNFSDIKKLSTIINKIQIKEYDSLFIFIKERFLGLLKNEELEIENEEIDEFISLLRCFEEEINTNPTTIISLVASNLSFYSDLQSFKLLNELYPKEFEEFELSSEFCEDTLPKILENEYSNADENNLKEVLETLETLENEYNVDASYEIQNIQEKIEKQEQQAEEYDEIDYYDGDEFDKIKHQRRYEDTEIVNMFSSLKYE